MELQEKPYTDDLETLNKQLAKITKALDSKLYDGTSRWFFLVEAKKALQKAIYDKGHSIK